MGTRGSVEIKNTIEDSDNRIREIHETADTLNSDVEKMKTAIEGMSPTGEYDGIIQSMESEVRQDVESTKETEVFEKTDDVKSELNETSEDNEETKSSLETDIDKANELKSSVAKNVESIAESAGSNLESGLSDRTELGDRLEDTSEDADEVEMLARTINI